MFTQAQVNAFGRNVISGVSGAAGMFLVLHMISPGDSANVQTGTTDIVDGISKVFSGILILAPTVMGWIASWSASHAKQVQAVQQGIDSGAIKGVTLVKTDPAPPL